MNIISTFRFRIKTNNLDKCFIYYSIETILKLLKKKKNMGIINFYCI